MSVCLHELISDFEKKATKAVPIHEKDYEKEGLVYCYKCNTPKQCRQSFFGNTITVPCLCECEEKRIQQEKERERVEKIRGACISDTRLHSYTFANDNGRIPEAMSKAKKYVANFDKYFKDGICLLFYGSVGYGKTYAAASIANALIDIEKQCLFTDFPQLARKWEALYAHKEEFLKGLNAYDLLIIDDFGVERQTETMQEMVHSIIDSRLREGKPMVITTNMTGEELKHPTDIRKERIYSRLLGKSIAHHCQGEDQRKLNFLEINREFDEQMKNTK